MKKSIYLGHMLYKLYNSAFDLKIDLTIYVTRYINYTKFFFNVFL